MVAAEVHIEAMLVGVVSLVVFLAAGRQVPLADASGGIAGRLKLLGQRDLLER